MAPWFSDLKYTVKFFTEYVLDNGGEKPTVLLHVTIFVIGTTKGTSKMKSPHSRTVAYNTENDSTCSAAVGQVPELEAVTSH